MARAKQNVARDNVRLQNRLETLLEEMRIKLSSVISDTLGVSGKRILNALDEGETDPLQLAAMGRTRGARHTGTIVRRLASGFLPSSNAPLPAQAVSGADSFE